MYVGLDIPNAGRGNKPLDGRACGAGTHSLSIAPDGAVYPCNSLPLPIGNLHSARIQDDMETHQCCKLNWLSYPIVTNAVYTPVARIAICAPA